ncbi:MAG: hypothetical protein KGZ60_09730 [Truepera sp.]|nr:hypothetical protein [Truepera sp.]MBS3967518.1 hypothetical protein [Truepera sp.]
MGWLNQLLARLQEHQGPVLLTADPRWGAPHLIAALHKPQQPLVWCELSPFEADDPVAQGNKLAEAVKRALGSPLFGYGMPYRYGLSVLRQHLELLGPFTFALSQAEHGPAFAQDLLSLSGQGNLVVLHFSALPDDLPLPAASLLLGPAELRLGQAEALALAEGQLADEEVMALWQDAGGAYEPFLVALHERLSLPLPLRPNPEGPRLPPGHEVVVEPDTLLDLLGKRQRWLEALELATTLLPERVPEVLAEAGPAYRERGLHRQLWNLLAGLPPEVAGTEAVLYWRLSAAARLSLTDQVREEVEGRLQEHEAPELRALYALVLAPPEWALGEAKRAYEAAQTPLTLYAYGWQLCTSDLHHGYEVLRASVKLAEAEGRPYQIARNTGVLASSLISLGRYREAAHWAEWALEQFDRAGLADLHQRLYLINDWAYARILIGETAGLEGILTESEARLSEVNRDLARLFRSTLGDYYLAVGKPEQALGYYRQNWEGAKRDMGGAEANNLVRALLELGETDEALKVAERAYSLTQGETSRNAHRGLLAYGMALSLVEPGKALTPLQGAYRAFQTPLDADLLAQAGLYLARVQLLLGSPDEAKEALRGAKAGLSELAEVGLHFRAGPREALGGVFSLLNRDDPPLALRFLGGSEVRLAGKPLGLQQRGHEILALLALHPEGLSGEQLLLLIYGDEGSPDNLKPSISKLRRLLPIAAKPYRLEVPLRADFLELTRLLHEGRVREAVSLYQGPLLPRSDLPGISEARELLEEQLRQAVLAAGDAESLLELAQRLGGDLQLWEAALAALSKEDPRAPLVRARVARIHEAWASGM